MIINSMAYAHNSVVIAYVDITVNSFHKHWLRSALPAPQPRAGALCQVHLGFEEAQTQAEGLLINASGGTRLPGRSHVKKRSAFQSHHACARPIRWWEMSSACR